MIRDRPETAVQSDSTGNFYIPEVRQSYFIHVIWFHEEWNIPRTRDKCFIVSISHPSYDPVMFDVWDQKRVVPTRRSDPFILNDVLLVPKSR